MIKNNSKKINKGDTFIAIKGVNSDGHDYIIEAINNGASKVIVEQGLYNVETIVVDDTKKYLEKYLYDNYYELIKNIKLIGITGTNGKTTTAFLTYQALNKLNKKTAYIGTIGFYLNDNARELNNTTPDILELYQMLIECSNNNIEYVVMEVSSQAMSYGRVNTLLFDYAIFTNLTQDHLDYHITMKNYALAKRKLFDLLKEDGVSIINSDDLYYKMFITLNCITYGKNGDYKLELSKDLIVNNEIYKTNLIGDFNKYNLTALIALLDNLKLDYKNIISELYPPKGRMQIINYNDKLIIIDYAHTPDAVLKVLKTFNEKVITVIGCGGNRDKLKRPIIGKIATENSEFVIFTNDNPRNENEDNIINDIINGLKNNNYDIIKSREEAIKKGIQMLDSHDILVILGKGHENYQQIGNEKFHFDDFLVALNYIRR
ncbi:MAG: UDP-N-acetylmuramoyl-L-alanyl-D-glutamate--2,6-diaminopimelate ligase [Mycoplasmatota bacterium]